METYKDADDFIIQVFPLEYQKIIKRKKSKLEKDIEKADAEFDKELENILKGKKRKINKLW